MSVSYSGWLPYGTDDTSVMIRHPLTAEMTAADLNCSSKVYYGTGVDDGGIGLGRATFDTRKGMLLKNDTGYLSYRFTGLTDSTKLANGGQLTFEVSRDWVCTNENGSTGWNAAVLETIFAASQGGLDNMFNRTSIIATSFHSGSSANFNIWDKTTGTLRVHSAQKGEYIKINIGWGSSAKGGFTVLAIDGLPIMSAVRNNAAYSNKWNSFWFGSGNASNFLHSNYPGDCWIRNFQVSNRPPVFPVHPALSKVLYFGDSIVGNKLTNAPQMDCNGSLSILRSLANKGLFVGSIEAVTRSGRPVSSAQTAGANLNDEIQAYLVTHRPTMLYLRGGTNDSDSDIETNDFENALQTIIERAFGLNGQPSTTVQKMVVGNIPSKIQDTAYFTSGDEGRILKMNKVYDGIVEWFNATYPLRAGDLALARCYEYMKGNKPDPVTYIGQNSTTNPQDIHPAAGGNTLMGRAYGDATAIVLSAG